MRLFRRSLILTLLVQLACCLAVHAGGDDGVVLRSFFHDLVGAAGSPRTSQAEEIRKVFAHYPQVVEWVADGRDPDELMREADLQSAVSSMTGADDLTGFLRTEMRSQVEGWLTTWGGQQLAPTGDIPPELRVPARRAAFAFSRMSEPRRVSLLALAGDPPFERMGEEINTRLEHAQFSSSEAIAVLIDPNEGFSHSNPAIDSLVQDLLPKYFDALAIEDKRALVMNLLKTAPRSSIEVQLAAVLDSTGPVLQKVFQLVGRDAKSERIQAVMATLQSNIKPFDGTLARRIVEQRLGRPISEVFSEFSDQPLAAATIGQVHLARLKSTGEQVIVKVRRPTVREAARREMAAIKNIAEGTPAQTLVNKVQESLEEELDFRIEAEHLLEGEVYYHPRFGIDIARRVEEIPAAEDLLVTRVAPGATISSFGSTPEELALRGKAVYNLLQRWFDEAVFGSGFFHGDLHPGNIFFVKKPGGPGFQVTLIDFGNAGRLTLKQRRGFLKIVLAAFSNSPEEMLRALEEVGTVPAAKRGMLLASLEELSRTPMGLMERLNFTMARALENNIELPTQLLAFNRGRMFLEKQLADINSQLASVDPRGRLPRFDATRTYARIGIKRVGLELPRDLVSASARENSVITRELFQLLWRNIGKVMSYFKPCGSLLKRSHAP
jgi:predicted unusual protein kinase regulating ubiquinone biosynthesis (AarF/ABC1/UbiB family)